MSRSAGADAPGGSVATGDVPQNGNPGGGAGGGEAHSQAATLGRILREGLEQLCQKKLPPERLFPGIVTFVSEVVGVKAAALLGYEAAADRLLLLASSGADASALKALTQGSGRAIPLRAMKQRVRNVVKAGKIVITAIPFEHEGAAIGVVVLFAPSAAPVGGDLLDVVAGSLGRCGAAVAAVLGERAAGEEAQAGESFAPMPEAAAPEQEEIKREVAAAPVIESDELRQQFEEVTAALRERTETVALLEQQVQELSRKASRADQLEEALAASTAARSALETDLARVREEIAEVQRRGVDEKAVEIALVRASLEAESEARLGLEEELTRLRSVLADTQGELGALQLGTEAATEQWTARVQTLEDETRELSTQLGAAQAEIERIAAERTRLQEELSATHARLQERVAEGQAFTQATSARVAALEAERTQLQDEAQRRQLEFDDTCAQLREQVKALEDDRQAAASRSDAVLQLVAELEAELEALRGDQTGIDKLQAALLVGDRAYGALEVELARAFDTLNEARGSLMERLVGEETGRSVGGRAPKLKRDGDTAAVARGPIRE